MGLISRVSSRTYSNTKPKKKEKKMASFSLPEINFNTKGWGPCEEDLPEKYKHLPYQPFCKSDKIGRVADWTGSDNRPNRWGRNHWSSGMAMHGQNLFEVGDNFRIDTSEKGDFNLVNASDAKPSRGFQKGGWNNRYDKDKERQTQAWANSNQIQNRTRINHKNKKQFRKNFYSKNVPKEHSIKIDPTWKLIEHYQTNNMKKMFKQPVGEDVKICGEARKYDKNYDTVNRNKKLLQPELIENVDFQYPTTLQDDFMKKYAGKNLP